MLKKISSADKITEVMVHPDYDKNGLLIDREGDYADGIALGKPLSEVLSKVAGEKKTCYRELK